MFLFGKGKRYIWVTFLMFKSYFVQYALSNFAGFRHVFRSEGDASRTIYRNGGYAAAI